MDKINEKAKSDKKSGKKAGVKFVDPEVEEVAFHIRVMNAEIEDFFKMSKQNDLLNHHKKILDKSSQ